MNDEKSPGEQKRRGYRNLIVGAVGILILLLIAYVVYSRFIRQERIVQPAFAEPAFAVIPVSNTMCDPELAFLADGLHDAIVNELGSVSNLLVKSKSASDRYRDSDLPLQQIADELGANLLVEPWVECTEEGLLMHLDMIELPGEEKIYSITEPLELADILTDSREVILRLLKQLDIDLNPQDEKHLNTARPVNSELYKLYAQGIFYMNKMTHDDFEKGVQYMNQAIAMNPSEPLPYLGLAMGYSSAGHVSEAAADASSLAIEYALKALELDSTLAEAYTIIANDYLYRKWDFAAAEKAYKMAIGLNSNIAVLHYNLGWYLCLTEQFDEAAEEMKKAVEIDPLDPICTGYLGWLYLSMNRNEDAIIMANKTLELEPNYTMAYYVIGKAYSELGRHEEAIEAHQKGVAISPDYLDGLGTAYAKAGRKDEALAVAKELEQYDNVWYASGLAGIYAALGDKEKTIQWLQVMYDQRHDFTPWIKSGNTGWELVYDDPRFQNIVDMLNLPG